MSVNIGRSPIQGGALSLALCFPSDDGGIYLPHFPPRWTLYAKTLQNTWEVFNNRLEVPLHPASQISLLLSGADLEHMEGFSLDRRILVEWVYSSGGEEIMAREFVDFSIRLMPLPKGAPDWSAPPPLPKPEPGEPYADPFKVMAEKAAAISANLDRIADILGARVFGGPEEDSGRLGAPPSVFPEGTGNG